VTSLYNVKPPPDTISQILLIKMLRPILKILLIKLLFPNIKRFLPTLKAFQKTLSTTVFLYFACILPAIALGVLNAHNTGECIQTRLKQRGGVGIVSWIGCVW
jgi:hypothetical protein